MAESDILPQDGEAWYDAPKDQTDAQNLERAKFFQSLPIFDEIIEWLKDNIDEFRDVSSIQTTKTTFSGNEVSSTVSIEGQLLAAQISTQRFKDKLDELERRKEEFKDDSENIEDVKAPEKPKN